MSFDVTYVDFLMSVYHDIPHVNITITRVRIAVAKLELISFTPTLAKIAVSAAKNADSRA